jgi:hypothetical protein
MLHMIYTHTCTTTTYLGEKGEHSVSRRLDLVVASIVIGTTGNQDSVRFRMGGGWSHFLTTHTQLYKVPAAYRAANRCVLRRVILLVVSRVGCCLCRVQRCGCCCQVDTIAGDAIAMQWYWLYTNVTRDCQSSVEKKCRAKKC